MRPFFGAVAFVMMTAVAGVPEADIPPTPKPAVGMSEAIELARTKLMTGYGLVGPQTIPPQEYLFLSATYKQERKGIWHWEVTFAHPTHTKYTARYTVSMEGTADLYDSRPSPDDLAPTEPCNMDEYADQLGMSLCSDHNYKLVDSELNGVYKEKMSQFKDDSSRSNLRASERRWINASQIECDRQIGPRKDGGTSWPMLMNHCKIAKIKARITFLNSCTDLGCPSEQP